MFTASFIVGALAQQVVPITNFGDSGTYKQVIQNSYADVNSTIIQPDGKLLISVTSQDDFGYSSQELIYRLTPTGIPDKSFGSNGIIHVGNLINDFHYGITYGGYFDLQQDGKIVAANYKFNRDDIYPEKFVIERYLPNGTPDSSFGINGVRDFTSYHTLSFDFGGIRGIKVRPDGKILVLASIFAPPAYNSSTVIAEFNKKGFLDSSFGKDGIYLSPSPYEQDIQQLIVLPGNRFVTASLYDKSERTAGSCEVIHKEDGTIDSTKGISGVIFNHITSESYSEVGLALQQDRKLLVYTTAWIKNSQVGVLLRYNADGTPDKSFGINGKTIVASYRYSYYNYDPHIIGVQENGRIIVNVPKQLRRFRTDGTPDFTFGNNGVLAQPAMNESENFVLDNERLYVAGSTIAGISFPKLIVNAYKFCNDCTGDNDGLITHLKVPGAKSETIKLFPNPVRDNLTITGLSNDEISHLQLTDATGRIIQKAATQSPSFGWNMRALPTGVYYLNVIKETGLPVTFKVIKE